MVLGWGELLRHRSVLLRTIKKRQTAWGDIPCIGFRISTIFNFLRQIAETYMFVSWGEMEHFRLQWIIKYEENFAAWGERVGIGFGVFGAVSKNEPKTAWGDIPCIGLSHLHKIVYLTIREFVLG